MVPRNSRAKSPSGFLVWEILIPTAAGRRDENMNRPLTYSFVIVQTTADFGVV
jgi:hypothetical protein